MLYKKAVQQSHKKLTIYSKSTTGGEKSP